MNEKQASVAARIAELACLPMSELWTVWDRYFPRRPDYPNRTHVESRLAYKLQEEAFGGLAPETKQRLEAIGRHGAELVPNSATILTHCNTGALATGGRSFGIFRVQSVCYCCAPCQGIKKSSSRKRRRTE